MTVPITVRTRIPAVDSLRLLAAVAVVLIHFWPREPGGWKGSMGIWVCGLGRFAVPFFFAASGYFLSKRLDSPRESAGLAWKWLKIVVLWQLVHIIWFYLLDVFQGHSTPLPPWLLRNLGWTGLFEGPAWPLWYLHSLVFTILATGLLSGRLRPLAWIGAVLLFGWALLAGPWKPVVQGFVEWPFSFNPRGFLFTSWVPFLWGATQPAHPGWKSGAIITAGGIVILLGEILWIHADPSWPPDFLLGGMVAGVGLLRLALSQGARFAPLSMFGAASLPMYLTQLILFSILRTVVEAPLSVVLPDRWSLKVAGTLLAMVPFVWICARTAKTSTWKRLVS